MINLFGFLPLIQVLVYHSINIVEPTNTVIFSTNYCVTIAYYVRHPISTKYSLSLMIDSSLKCYRKPSLHTPVGRQAAAHHQIVTDRTSSARKLLLIPLADKLVCRVVAQQIRWLWWLRQNGAGHWQSWSWLRVVLHRNRKKTSGNHGRNLEEVADVAGPGIVHRWVVFAVQSVI